MELIHDNHLFLLASLPQNPRYSTTDHWIQESIKQIFNSGLFWAVRAAVNFFFQIFKNNIVASALKSYIIKSLSTWTENVRKKINAILKISKKSFYQTLLT